MNGILKSIGNLIAIVFLLSFGVILISCFGPLAMFAAAVIGLGTYITYRLFSN
jgi:hypothetical protein